MMTYIETMKGRYNMIKFIGKTTNGITLINGEFESWEELYFESLNNDLLFNNALEIA